MDDQEGFIGMLIVHKDFRRRGIAKKLLERTIQSLGNRNITLYGSPAGVSLYKKVGFRFDENPAYIYERTFLPKKDCLKGTGNFTLEIFRPIFMQSAEMDSSYTS